MLDSRRSAKTLGSECWRDISFTEPPGFPALMRAHFTPPESLRKWIRAILGGSIAPKELNEFVAFCHTIAVVAVRSRIPAPMLHNRTLQENFSDIAYDCLADLFRQDDHGNLVQVKAFFESIDCDRATDQELVSELRRLVFSKVNNGIFRILNEADPVLGKIIRNIKLAAQALQSFVIVDRFGDICIHPASCDTLGHLPSAEKEDLEIALRQISNGSENIPTLLARLSRYLRDQTKHSRIVAIISVALVFRSLYETNQVIDEEDVPPENRFIPQEVESAVKETCVRLKSDMESTYLGRKKVSSDLYGIYFDLIESTLVDKLVGGNGESNSLYEALRQYIPGLTRKEYRYTHRGKLEYLSKLAYEQTVSSLKKRL
jgi:hypothetical protein